ncbi:hypothetical protein D9611_001434 [Ephemerocybe angulata]|uniref:Uncharacterized protein n=1 Tax=Ephemerocybe angulata TaxID=980116 RepID=A0A8H5CK38_9AGAR|nr:hypothetical protein D9611_001434 [Tulosesus angulatus]
MRITYLLEPYFKGGVEHRDEGNGFLPRTLRDGQEVCAILSRKQLLPSKRVLLEELLDERQRLVKRRIRLKQRRLDSSTIDTGESLLDAAQPISSQVPEGDVDPSLLDDLLIGHIPQILRNTPILLPPEPRLGEVLVQLRDHLILPLLQPRHTLFLGQLEDTIIKLLPQLDGTGRDLVDGLAKLRSHGENTAGRLRVRSLPLSIVNASSGDDEVLDGGAGVRLLRDHDATGEEETIEGHGLDAEARNGPVTGEVLVDILRRTEAGATNEDDVGVLTDRAVGREDGLVEVLERVVSPGTSTSPLHDDGEVGVGRGDVDDLTDAVDGTRLERDVLDSSGLESLNDLDSLLGGGDASSNTEAFDGEPLLPHLLPERELEGELARVDVEGVEGNADAIGNQLLNLSDLGTKSLCVVVSSTRQLDVVSSIQDGTDKAGLDSGRGHTSNHDGGLSEQTRERGIEEELALAANHVLVLDVDRAVELDVALATKPSNDDPNTTTLEVPRRERTNAAGASRTEVNGVSGSLGEVRGLAPVDRRGEDLFAQRTGDRSRELAQVGTCKYQFVVDGNLEVLRLPELLTLQIVLDQLLSQLGEIGAVVWDADDQETDREDGLALGEGDLALIGAASSLDLAEGGDEAEESLGRAGDDEGLGAVVEGDEELRVLGEVLVSLRDMWFKLLQDETGDGQHGAGSALTTLDGVLHDGWVDGGDGEGLLATEAGIEEPFEGLARVGGELLKGRRR